MTQHVFTRVAGFRLIVTPYAPFRIERTDAAPGAIDVEYQSPNGRLFARLIPDNGGYKSKLSQDTASLYDVLDVDKGPDLDEWRLETTVFTCAWPHGYTLCSNNFPDDPGPFDLIGKNHEMIYIQNPRRLPAIEEMCAPYQTIKHIERGAESQWIELEYTYDGQPWCQRHEIIELPESRLGVTMQAPADFAPDAVSAAREVARSLAPA